MCEHAQTNVSMSLRTKPVSKYKSIQTNDPLLKAGDVDSHLAMPLRSLMVVPML